MSAVRGAVLLADGRLVGEAEARAAGALLAVVLPGEVALGEEMLTLATTTGVDAVLGEPCAVGPVDAGVVSHPESSAAARIANPASHRPDRRLMRPLKKVLPDICGVPPLSNVDDAGWDVNRSTLVASASEATLRKPHVRVGGSDMRGRSAHGSRFVDAVARWMVVRKAIRHQG